jgi:outer membrane protein TolC
MFNKFMSTKLSWLLTAVALILCACAAPEAYVRQADDAAYAIIAEKQQQGGEEPPLVPFCLESADSVEHHLRQKLLTEQMLPGANASSAKVAGVLSGQAYKLPLIEALQVAAYNSREYQLNKEQVFRAALALDLQRDNYGNSFSGFLSSMWSTQKTDGTRVSGLSSAASGGWEYNFKSGVAFATSIGFDLVQLLTANRVSARGIIADTSISIPLLRGAGQRIVTEPLQQAERDMLYALWSFARYQRSFAVQIASEYLLVLERINKVSTAYDNYQRLVSSRQRAQRLADAGRLPRIQVEQALQDELRARSSWVSAQQVSENSLDSFKIMLGLPVDAALELDSQILTKYADLDLAAKDIAVDAAPQGLLATALAQRRDLRIARGKLIDARRQIAVAEDNLRAEVTLLGSGSAGNGRSLSTADSDDGHLDLDHGLYSALLTIDLPLERTAERNALRTSLLDWQQQKRTVEGLEDTVKYQVRSAWRGWHESLALIKIQAQALEVAQRRVASTDLFLQAGRIQMRDLLEAQDALVLTHDALVAAQVQYRISAMELKRDLGTLKIDAAGAWLEDIAKYDGVVQE